MEGCKGERATKPYTRGIPKAYPGQGHISRQRGVPISYCFYYAWVLPAIQLRECWSNIIAATCAEKLVPPGGQRPC